MSSALTPSHTALAQATAPKRSLVWYLSWGILLVLLAASWKGAHMLMATAAPGQTLEEAGVAFVQQHRPSSIIGRAAQLEEVANMVAYVASPLSSATTGAALRVEGGIVDSL